MAVDLGGAAAGKKKKETAAERNARLQAAFNLKQAAAVSSEPTVTGRRDEALKNQTLRLHAKYGQAKPPARTHEGTRLAQYDRGEPTRKARTQADLPSFFNINEMLSDREVTSDINRTALGGGLTGMESAGFTNVAKMLEEGGGFANVATALDQQPGFADVAKMLEEGTGFANVAHMLKEGGGFANVENMLSESAAIPRYEEPFRERANVHGSWADAFKDAPYQEAIRRLIQQRMWDELNLSRYYDDTPYLGDTFALDDEYDGGGWGGGGGGINPNDPYWWMNLVKWNI